MKVEWIRAIAAVVLTVVGTTAFGFGPIPGESVEALGKETGKSHPAGLVFVCGKYVPPPYVVERRGTGLFINSHQVTGQVVEWTEFLKTQPNVKVVREEPVEPAATQTVAKVEEKKPEVPDVSEAVSSLDSLFDDEDEKSVAASAEKKPAAVKKEVRPAAKPKPRPAAKVTYELKDGFVVNDASKALLKRIDSARAELDRVLRGGGFVCLGERYQRVTGDKRTLLVMLQTLPEAMQQATNQRDFNQRLQAAKLVFLTGALSEDIFRNRVDFRKLKVRRSRLQMKQKWDKVVEEASDPLF